MADLNYDKLLTNLRGGMYRYIQFGVLPGSFLTAVLSNDLKESCLRADDDNRKRLFEIVYWLYNEAPSPCWGSKEKVEAWMVYAEQFRATATEEERIRYG